ncbi:MAG: hypothetical protein H8F28_09580 [Fibrella sp.]|nr:hypothetical protein [Armatimonadota bacterium]
MTRVTSSRTLWSGMWIGVVLCVVVVGCAEKTGVNAGDRTAQEKALQGGPMPPDVAARVAEAQKNAAQQGTNQGKKAAEGAASPAAKPN